MVCQHVVSASDIMPTGPWLNVWCIWYTYLETLQECRSCRRIGWIFRRRVVCSSSFRLETKMPWRQTPSRKKKAVVFTTVTSACQDQLNAGFSKCEIFKVHSIESLKYVREFYTVTVESVIVETFPCPELWCCTKQNVIGCLTCRSNGIMGGPWPMNAQIYSRPSAVSLKVWLRETSQHVASLTSHTKTIWSHWYHSIRHMLTCHMWIMWTLKFEIWELNWQERSSMNNYISVRMSLEETEVIRMIFMSFLDLNNQLHLLFTFIVCKRAAWTFW